MKRLRIRGDVADLAIALDRLCFGASVLGIVEGDGQCEVAVDGEVPDLGAVEVVELDPGDGITADGIAVTGFERDAWLRVGDAILVRPPWVEPPAGFAGVELVVPRAMAFGSGEHGSTQAALCVMERMWDVAIESVADVGSGSGILALYAAQRGSRRVYACDVDPQAVIATRDLVPDACVVLGGPSALPEPVDAVVANMRATEIHGCLVGILGRWNRRGPLVLSGLKSDETAAVVRAVGEVPDERIAVAGFTALGWTAPLRRMV